MVDEYFFPYVRGAGTQAKQNMHERRNKSEGKEEKDEKDRKKIKRTRKEEEREEGITDAEETVESEKGDWERTR